MINYDALDVGQTVIVRPLGDHIKGKIVKRENNGTIPRYWVRVNGNVIATSYKASQLIREDDPDRMPAVGR